MARSSGSIDEDAPELSDGQAGEPAYEPADGKEQPDEPGLPARMGAEESQALPSP